ncbi:MAG: twin-arginine translocation signal domain-containing protein [Bacteroidota bacterium]|nr:twin-arginine translocation signal domain-containing protein [Bacteroidota bacterium]
MTDQTRREFIKQCCVVAAASALGCKQKIEMTSQQKDFEPAYMKLHQNGELKKRGEELWAMMKECRLCPRECGTNRLAGERGFCQANAQIEISSYNPHFGEEKPLVGKGGSGTIFLTNCGLRCVFCINWEISQGGQGSRHTLEDMADMMLHLQKIGCHNINFVTPTHYSPHILLATDIAAARGLRLPIVYNTCGWEKLEILKILDGVVDIYLPDFKYWDGKMAAKYSSEAETYPEVTATAVLEMHRQVGVAKPASDGLMYQGLMIRHLVMPNKVGGTIEIIKWIADNLPKDTYVNIMSQYRPMYKAFDYPEINRSITRSEYKEVVDYAEKLGLTNLDIQGYWF